MSISQVNGYATAGEFVGRDVKFVKVNYSGIAATVGTVNGNFDKAVKVLEQYSTVTIVGTAATDDCMFMVEGLPAYVADHSQGGDNSSGTAIATKLKADLEASIGSGTATFTVYSGLGSTGFAA